jgi:predicted DNA binding CopG/RHH family protein
MTKPTKPIPKFASEAQECAYWQTHTSTGHFDWSNARKVTLPNLKPSTKTISLRLPRHLLDSVKVAANSWDVLYQSLIKVWLQKKLQSL